MASPGVFASAFFPIRGPRPVHTFARTNVAQAMSQDTRPRTIIQSIKGMEDLLPADSARFQHVEKTAREIFGRYGYGEVRTPILEVTELFARSAGEASDIMVSKQMYTFTDPGDRSNTMRPEGTAGVVRALVQKGSFKELPIHKLYYMGPMFRYERPQKGRQRQFHQVGAEFFGVAHPAADVEIISLCDQLLKALGFQNIVTKVNTIGCPDCRKAYNEKLRAAILDNPVGWCEQCLERARVNPMRVFDCKVPSCGELVRRLPRINDSVCADCQSHFDSVIALLNAAGIAYEKDDSLVRGFDYYTRTVFEVMQGNIGAQSAILGGGRYDGLVAELGGPQVPAVGMGIGIERLLLAMEASGIAFPTDAPVDFYALALDEESLPAVFELTTRLRSAGRNVAFDCQPRGMKPGLKVANRAGAREILIIGSNERERGIALRKNLETGEQVEAPLAEL